MFIHLSLKILYIFDIFVSYLNYSLVIYLSYDPVKCISSRLWFIYIYHLILYNFCYNRISVMNIQVVSVAVKVRQILMMIFYNILI